MKDLTPVPLTPVPRTVPSQDYLAIDVDAVWLAVDQELPRLRAALERMEKRSPVV